MSDEIRSRGRRASDLSCWFSGVPAWVEAWRNNKITKEVHAMWGTFTSSNSILLLIDHQVGTMKLIKNIPLEVVKRNTLALAKAAKILKIPVVLTTGTENKVQGPLMPE